MKRLLRYFLICVLVSVQPLAADAQTVRTHKVQKKDTQYGIARMYGISVEQLVKANPGMELPGYKLKKGTVINIPEAGTSAPAPVSNNEGNTDVRNRSIRMGIMLPLHNVNNDGKRMIEYYRGLLMACDSMKKEGISVDIHAWNLAENGDVKPILEDPAAAKCDIIIGPLYSKFVAPMAEFTAKNKSLLVIPFSIHAPELLTNRNIFQIYQNPDDLNESTARRCAQWFKDYHPIIIDCADATSTKGGFTSAYRRQLEILDVPYSLTSLKSEDSDFAKAFVKDKPNLVILNTARSQDLLAVFGRLHEFHEDYPGIRIAMFGYTEWMMYLQYQQANFHKYNVHIPAPFFTNLESPVVERIQSLYRQNFKQDMMVALPRFAMTGFDHGVFFLRGLHKYGMTFDGAAGRFGYQPLQTPLKFERLGNGGLQNRAFMFVHFKDDNTVETVNY